jgi:hypothetical protein
MKNSEAYKVIKEVYENSGLVFYDFRSIAHNDYEYPVMRLDCYGYYEYVELAKCLSLFEDFGYDQITETINYILYEVKEASTKNV